jgi:hypothetical protein
MTRLHGLVTVLLTSSLVAMLVCAWAEYPAALWVLALLLLVSGTLGCGVLALVFPRSRRLVRWLAPKNSATVTPPRGIRWFLLGFACLFLALLAAQLLIPPLPEAVTRWLILHSEGWILSAYQAGLPDGPAGPAPSAYHQFVATMVEHSLIYHFGRRHRVSSEVGDVGRLKAYLVPLKRRLLTQNAIPHGPRAWPVFISGIGFCDQVNRVAALLLAREFPRSQTYNLLCAEPYAGHTIGRVWSNEFHDWLYYDLWGDEVVVFRLDGAGAVDFLAREHPLPVSYSSPAYDPILRRLYDRTKDGWVQKEYHATFGRYLFEKIWEGISGRPASQPAPPEDGKAAEALLVAPRGPALNEQEVCDSRAVDAFYRSYLEARLEHILGDESRATAKYRVLSVTDAEDEQPVPILRAAAAQFGRF